MGDDVIAVLNCGQNSAKVHLFGATIISWKVDDQEILFVRSLSPLEVLKTNVTEFVNHSQAALNMELIFLSPHKDVNVGGTILHKKSLFDNKKAIRGGIPFVFPQFGPWEAGPQHGFARVSMWSLKDKAQNGSDQITFILEDNETTRSMWNNKFRIEYTVSLKQEKLRMDVTVLNLGDTNFPFTMLLHTYFSVPNVLLCSVTELKGCTYIDKVKGGTEFTEDREKVQVSEFTDRVYKNTGFEHKIENVSGNKSIKLEKMNFPDTVVWNPWSKNARSMGDFGDEEWENMLCVEAGYVHSPFILDPKHSFHAAQILSLVD